MQKRFQIIAILSFLMISVLLIQVVPVALADPYPDPNERLVPDNRDFQSLDGDSNGTSLSVIITFYGTPAFDEFLIYVDPNGSAAAEVLIKCHKKDFEIYKQTDTGEYTDKVHTGKPVFNGKTYQISIPLQIAFGKVSSVGIWAYEKTGKDRVPDNGSISVSTSSL
jgi:hypothetical protein